MKPVTIAIIAVTLLTQSCKTEVPLPEYNVTVKLTIGADATKKYAIKLPESYQYTHSDNMLIHALEDTIMIEAIDNGNGYVKYWNGNDTFINLKTSISSTLQVDTGRGVLMRDSAIEIMNYEPARRLYDRVMINKPLPDFSVAGIEGGTITTDDVKGRISAINFWYYSCGACQLELPSLREAAAYFKKKEYQLFAFCKDSGYAERGKTFFFREGVISRNGGKFERFKGYEEMSLDAKHGINAKPLEQTFRFHGYPHTYLVDKNGVIRYLIPGGSERVGAELIRQADMLEHFHTENAITDYNELQMNINTR